MKLSGLLGAIDHDQWFIPQNTNAEIESDPEITSIHYRSDTVLPGGIFTAIRGFSADGHDYIADAVKRGARAVIVEHPVNVPAVVVVVKDARKALPVLAGRFYNRPGLKLCVIGVTGTNGKTTTTYILENILNQAGFSVGVIGTINYRYGDKVFNNPRTTPESMDLQKILAEMVEHKVTHVVMEVSSIAIDLSRVEECFFDVGIFTNFTQDHLDYHKDMEAYWGAKKRFFTEVLTTGPKGRGAVAVINCNDARGKDLFEKIKTNKISVGFSSSAMVAPVEMSNTLNGITGILKTPLGSVGVSSSLVGGYNIENILCAAGAAVALQINPEAICSGVHATSYIPGRLDAVPNGLGRFVYVDYAHTPDALKNALETLDALKTGKIICVFGCGGNRDKSKRGPMGEIAGKICDLAVITTDNPRNEDPMEIILEIERGVKANAHHCFSVPDVKNGVKHKGYVVIPDRESAITNAIHASRAGDIVLIAGKGHETYQIVGDRTLAFDDKEVAQKVLQQLEARP